MAFANDTESSKIKEYQCQAAAGKSNSMQLANLFGSTMLVLEAMFCFCILVWHGAESLMKQRENMVDSLQQQNQLVEDYLDTNIVRFNDVSWSFLLARCVLVGTEVFFGVLEYNLEGVLEGHEQIFQKFKKVAHALGRVGNAALFFCLMWGVGGRCTRDILDLWNRKYLMSSESASTCLGLSLGRLLGHMSLSY